MPVSQEKYGAIEIFRPLRRHGESLWRLWRTVTDPNDIVAALERGIEATRNGQAALLEFITSQEIDISNE